MRRIRLVLWGVLVGAFACGLSSIRAAVATATFDEIGYISELAQTPFNTSPTIVQTVDGLLAAWIGSSSPDSLDACVYLSRNTKGMWERGEKVVESIDPKTLIQSACERPVLFKPTNGSLLLFYKVRDARARRQGMLVQSADNGQTWTKPKKLPRLIGGPARTKPVEISPGVLLMGADSHEAGWVVHVEQASAFRSGWGWRRTRKLSSAILHNAKAPALLNHGNGDIQAICPTKRGYLVESWSSDAGETWEPFARTPMPNPDSGIDVVKRDSGEFIMVYPHSNRERGVLHLASTENGRLWSALGVIEHRPGRVFSDPSMIIGTDGNLHVVYAEDSRLIKHVTLDPDRLESVPMVGGNWPF